MAADLLVASDPQAVGLAAARAVAAAVRERLPVEKQLQLQKKAAIIKALSRADLLAPCIPLTERADAAAAASAAATVVVAAAAAAAPPAGAIAAAASVAYFWWQFAVLFVPRGPWVTGEGRRCLDPT